MRRTLYEPEHELFRETVRAWLASDVTPYHAQWEADGIVPREVWASAGKLGLLGTAVPEAFGGGGVPDYRFNAIVGEEIAAAGATGLGFGLHSDVALPYLLDLGTPSQYERWLPGVAAGTSILAIAMTEPGTGSDLAAIATTAARDGDEWVINGAKTFITNGINADLVIVVCRTGGAMQLSLLVVPGDAVGFRRGRKLDKIGLRAQDTAELFFDDVRVPASHLLGVEGKALRHLVEHLPEERLSVAVGSVAAADAVLSYTLDYVRERRAFGQAIGSFQASRFALAEMATAVAVQRSFVDQCVAAHVAGELTVEDAAMAKWSASELFKSVADRCLQLHGGYGYMREYPVARAFLDARVQTIYAGTTEIMKDLIGRSLGL